ncbi:MAG: hypothetical protein IKT98_04610 [Selenomonadaceae bacterium]|nr:hypothetical protein [Selenomonadaceae bacterium]
MTKKNISIALLIFMVITNVYLIWRVNSNTMKIVSYDAGISQRTGVGKLDTYWTKYLGGEKNSSITYEDRAKAEVDSNHTIMLLFFLDLIFVTAIFRLSKKPKPKPVKLNRDEEWERERRAMRRRR